MSGVRVPLRPPICRRDFAIFEAASSEVLHGFLMMWTGGLSTLDITPVLDDAGARAVISANLPAG